MEKTFQIKGMHCNSCAQLIENKLKEKVDKIYVSYSKEEAKISFDENKISEKEIIKEIESEGYKVITEEKEKKDKPLVGFVVLAASLVFLLYLLYRIIEPLGLQIPSVGDNASLLVLFLVGILTGFHCISMCGAFVVSYTAKNAINGKKGYAQHFIYGGAKVLSYAIIGGIFGLIGGLIAFNTNLRGGVAIFAGVFMVFYSLSLMGIKFFRKFQLNPKFLARFSARTSKKAEGYYKGPLITGLLTGLFIACGPLQAMYIYAAGTGNFFSGMFALAAFGLGTLPVMIGFGSFTSVISHSTTKKILKLSAIIVLILGLVMINRGLLTIGSPYSFESITNNFQSSPVSSISSTITDGYQVINMDVDSSGYSPNSFVIKKGIPVKWNVNVKELTGCNQELVLNQYGIDKNLQTGLNVIEFTPDKVGTISFTCGMGMLHGSFIVTDSGTASAAQVQSATPAKGASCSMGANGGGCGCGGTK